MEWRRLLGSGAKVAFWCVVAVVSAVVLFLLFRKCGDSGDASVSDTDTSFAKQAANNLSDAVAEVKVSNAIIRTNDEQRKKELQNVRDIEDGAERRERLAELLRHKI